MDTQTESKIEQAEAHMAEKLGRLDDAVKKIEVTRRFAVEYADKLAGTHWDFWAWQEVHIQCNDLVWNDGNIRDPREIARRFPGVVWKRTKNTYTCGSIDFTATIDGVLVVIEHAEKLQFKDGGVVSI